MIERQERSVDILRERNLAQLRQHPRSTLTIKDVLLDIARVEMNLLDNGVINRGVLDNLHVFLVVEKQRVIALAHKEMLYLPVGLRHHLGLAISLNR